MNIDKEIEYQTLRQEILDSITARDNYIITMYTITVAILCVAFELENPILFLIPYVVLFAFQNSIASKSENMIALAAYIAVYLEKGQGWESKNIEIKGTMQEGVAYKRPNSIWKYLIGRIGSVQLGVLCSISCIVYSAIEIMETKQVSETIEPGICIGLSVILYILIRVQTKNVLKLSDRRKKYINNLEKAKAADKEKELTSV